MAQEQTNKKGILITQVEKIMKHLIMKSNKDPAMKDLKAHIGKTFLLQIVTERNQGKATPLGMLFGKDEAEFIDIGEADATLVCKMDIGTFIAIVKDASQLDYGVSRGTIIFSNRINDWLVHSEHIRSMFMLFNKYLKPFKH